MDLTFYTMICVKVFVIMIIQYSQQWLFLSNVEENLYLFFLASELLLH